MKKTTNKQGDITLTVFCGSWIWETSTFFFADIFACFASEDDETLDDEEAVEGCTRKYEYRENEYETKRRYTRIILLVRQLWGAVKVLQTIIVAVRYAWFLVARVIVEREPDLPCINGLIRRHQDLHPVCIKLIKLTGVNEVIEWIETHIPSSANRFDWLNKCVMKFSWERPSPSAIYRVPPMAGSIPPVGQWCAFAPSWLSYGWTAPP